MKKLARRQQQQQQQEQQQQTQEQSEHSSHLLGKVRFNKESGSISANNLY